MFYQQLRNHHAIRVPKWFSTRKKIMDIVIYIVFTDYLGIIVLGSPTLMYKNITKITLKKKFFMKNQFKSVPCKKSENSVKFAWKKIQI